MKKDWNKKKRWINKENKKEKKKKMKKEKLRVNPL